MVLLFTPEQSKSVLVKKEYQMISRLNISFKNSNKKKIKKTGIAFLCAAAISTSLTMPASAAESISSECTIRIVHTNDVHGYYNESEDQGIIGFAKLKSLIDEKDADLILDVGDTFHGQAFATVEKGMSIAELMKETGYDAMTPGNHDWSYGAAQLSSLEDTAGFPILASNVITDSGEGFFETPYLIKEVTADDGTKLKIGIIGVIDDVFYTSTASENVAGLSFEEESQKAAELANVLRTEEQCDLVIAMTHQSDCPGFVSRISGIDAVIAGHQHLYIDKTYTDADGKSVPVVEAGHHFYMAGILELTIDPATMKIVKVKETAYEEKDLSTLSADENVNEKISEIEKRQAAVLDSVIGESKKEYPFSWEEIRVSEQKIGKLITASYLYKTGADIAIENAGGIRSGIPKGAITYRDLINISPYGNVLVTKTLTGQQILEMIEKSLEINKQCDDVYSVQKQAVEKGEDPYQYEWPDHSGSALQFGGIHVEYDMAREYGNRITQANINNTAIVKDADYIVAMNNYIAESGYYDELANAELLKEYGTCEEALRLFFATDHFEDIITES